ncbi:GNAT family N-acetyltransferase, partial [Klebsiella variicola]
MSIFDLRLETERLILRPLLREDYEPYLAFCADEETMRTLGGVQPPSVAWRGFCSLAGAWQLFGFSMFSVIEKSSGDWIG